MKNQKHADIYNLGTGIARSFNDLVTALFTTLGLPTNIEYIDTPIDIRASYQYYTQATMQKLKDVGYTEKFYSLEEGVLNYTKEYLLQDKIY